MLSAAHMRADSRAADIQRETYALVSGLGNSEETTVASYAGKCDAGIPLTNGGKVAVTLKAHGDMMMHVSIPAREFEYEASRYNAYTLLSDIRIFGVDFALRSLSDFFGI